MKQNKRSPLTDKPLRNPGQSLELRRNELLNDNVLAPMLLAVSIIWFAGMEWWYYFNPSTRSPVAYTITAAVLLGYAISRIWRTWPELKQLKQGIEVKKLSGSFWKGCAKTGIRFFTT